MRERATTLYITLGPSPLATPVNVGVGADRNGNPIRHVQIKPRPLGVKPISQLSCRDRYREAFTPKPARPAPTTSTGRTLHRIGAKILAWL